MTVSVPRARVTDSDGKQAEWRSKALPAYKRLTVQAERLIVGAYLAGTNTRRVRRALAALFGAGGWQGHRKPDLAQGAVRLRGLAEARSCRRRHRPPDPRRHGCPGSLG